MLRGAVDAEVDVSVDAASNLEGLLPFSEVRSECCEETFGGGVT